MNEPLSPEEIAQLQRLLDRARANNQFRVVDPTQAEFTYDFVMKEREGRALKLTIDWRGPGLPEVGKIVVERVKRGMKPEPEDVLGKSSKARIKRDEVEQQKEWIRQCGGDLAGYIKRYGSKNDPDHYGDGGEAIYKADTDYLKKLEAR